MNKKNAEFCIIAPTSYLQYVTATHTHLVLGHLVDTDEVYANFYLTLSEQGDTIIMDNSAYELKEPYSPDKLLQLGIKCGAHVIVLPDYPFKAGAITISAAKAFIPQFKEAGFRTFFVPQSERGDLNDYISTYQWAATNDDIDMIGCSILGMPNAIPYVHPAYARVVLTQMLIDRKLFNFKKHHHYLGLNAGPALEIPTLIRMNALDTVDSSGPVLAALLGHRYTTDADSLQLVSKLKMPVDFAMKSTNDEATHERILHNINMTLDLFLPENYNKEIDWFANE